MMTRRQYRRRVIIASPSFLAAGYCLILSFLRRLSPVFNPHSLHCNDSRQHGHVAHASDWIEAFALMEVIA